jgi:hypothetical protein
VLLASTIAGSANAASPAAVASKWGLIGRWAVDCANTKKVGGPHNLISYEARADGKIMYRRNDEPDDNNEITDVKLGENGMIVLTIVVPAYKQTREMGIAMDAQGRTRSMFNHAIGGDYNVRDGIFTETGKETPSLSRCR